MSTIEETQGKIIRELEAENKKLRAALMFIKDKSGTWEKTIDACEKALKS